MSGVRIQLDGIYFDVIGDFTPGEEARKWVRSAGPEFAAQFDVSALWVDVPRGRFDLFLLPQGALSDEFMDRVEKAAIAAIEAVAA